MGHNVAAGHHHGRVGVCSLFFGHGAHEDGMEVVGMWERDFDLFHVSAMDRIKGNEGHGLRVTRLGWSTLFASLS
jgi:hypothetical protein